MSLEYHVNLPGHAKTAIFDDHDRAVLHAFWGSVRLKCPIDVDVVCWCREDAKAWGGDDAARRYVDSYTDGTPFERFTVVATCTPMA